MAEIEKIRDEFKNEVALVLVYIKEAHPSDEWQSDNNVTSNVIFKQPQSFEARLEVARSFVDRMKVDSETLVDDARNTALACYAAWPERIYVIDGNGKIAFKSGMGPFYFEPDELRRFLVTLPKKPST